jgi:hypothetical protein
LSIPEPLEDGWLPEGVFDATLEELKERFGCFRTTERRTRMFASLREYLAEVKTWKIADVVYVDGSFISTRVAPEDVDVTFLLPDRFMQPGDLSPSETNLVQRAFTKKVYGVDAWPEPGVGSLERRIQSWLRMKPPMKGTKGLLRVTL